jgi:hypothetical protein
LRVASLLQGAAKICYGYGSQSPGTLNGFAGSTMRGWDLAGGMVILAFAMIAAFQHFGIALDFRGE